MKKQIIATIVGFIATFIANTLLAMTIIGPLFNDKLGISRDPVKDGLNFPAILIGYLTLTIFMVWLTPLVKGKTWLQNGLITGSATGLAVFVAGHLIVAGWSVASGSAMLFSGLIDSFATVIGSIAIAFILKNNDAK